MLKTLLMGHYLHIRHFLPSISLIPLIPTYIWLKARVQVPIYRTICAACASALRIGRLCIVLSGVQRPTLAAKCQVSCWFLLVSHGDSTPPWKRSAHVSKGLTVISSLFVALDNERSVRPDDIVWREITNYGARKLQIGTALVSFTWLAPPALCMSHSLHLHPPQWELPLMSEPPEDSEEEGWTWFLFIYS